MSFPIGTLLRFYPTEENHYTAVICSQGVYQVKGGNKECYSTVEEWCASLPGCPDVSTLHVTDPKESCVLQRAEKRAEKRALQPTRQSKLKWNVPSCRDIHRSLCWPRHIYAIIKEAAPALLQRVEICDAYNHLVNGLAGYSNIMYSYVPWYGARYRVGICIETLKDLTDTCISSPPNVVPFNRSVYDAACIDIMARYTTLYQYIKAEVVPYIKRRDWEVRSARILKFQQGCLRKFVNQHASVTKKYEKIVSELQMKIDHAQHEIHMASLPFETIQ